MIGIGAVRELFQFLDGEEFNAWVFVLSLATGLGVFEVIAYVSKRLTVREE